MTYLYFMPVAASVHLVINDIVFLIMSTVR